MLGGYEDPVGQLEVAEASTMQPVEGSEVEPAVSQVDREEVGRPGGLGFEDRLLLPDVAVDHAQDARDPHLPAERQGELGADIAEDEGRRGHLPLDLSGHEPIEPTRPPPGDRVLCAGHSSGQPVFDREGGVEAPGRPDPVGRNPAVVALA